MNSGLFVRALGVMLTAVCMVGWFSCEYPEEDIAKPLSDGGQQSTPLGTLYLVNGGIQVCNPSVSQDTVNFRGCMLWLGFAALDVIVPQSPEFSAYSLSTIRLHDRLNVTDYQNNLRWFLMRDSVPGVIGELQDPEWGAHPDYIAFLGKSSGGWDGFVVRLSDKAILKFCDDKMQETATPHVWVGQPTPSPRASNRGRLATGFLPPDSIWEFFGTINVKLTYSLRTGGGPLQHYLVDYSSCDTCDTVIAVVLPKPRGREDYHVEGQLISPDGQWLTFHCFTGDQNNPGTVFESYVQRFVPGGEPRLVASGAAEPHWWYAPDGRTFVVYTTRGGFTTADFLTIAPGSEGETLMQEVALSPTGPAYYQFRLVGEPFVLLRYPFKGGLSPDGYFVATGYSKAYMFKFN